VSADSKEQAEERLRNHPNLKDVVGLTIHELIEQGSLDEIEQRIASKVSDLDENLPTTERKKVH